MKKVAILVLSVGISFSSMAQKKELKNAEKLVKASETEEAMNILDAIEDSVKGTEFETYFYFVKGEGFFAKGPKRNFADAYSAFIKVLELETQSEGKAKYSEDAIEYIDNINDIFFKQVANQVKSSNYERAGNAYFNQYRLKPERRDLLRLALFNLSEAKSTQRTITVLENLLKEDKYETFYTAQDVHSKRTDEFFTKESRDNAISYKTHQKPKEEKIEKNVRENYYDLLVEAYKEQDNKEKALATLRKAKKEYPKAAKYFFEYVALLRDTKDYTSYLVALEEALVFEPSNTDLLFNCAVINEKLKNKTKAIEFYDKVIALDPEYRGAYINKGLIYLADEPKLIEELNNNLRNKKKYNEIDAKIKQMYLNVIPPFAKANELKADEGIKATLINLYQSVGQKDKADALK